MKAKQFIKYLLFGYTIVVVFVSIFISLGVVSSPGTSVQASCSYQDYNTVGECVSSCDYGCQQPGATTDVIACRNGCQYACEQLCQGKPHPNPQPENSGGNVGGCNVCAVYSCSFDSNGDGQCTFADEGARREILFGAACNVSVANQCKQVDYYPTIGDAEAGTNLCSNPPFRIGVCQNTSNTPSSCNEECGPNNQCVSGLSCTNISGVNRCRLPSNPNSLTCEPPVIVNNPSFAIDKYIDSPKSSYEIGDIVVFKIRITNTGNTAITNLRFRDVFNANNLRYVDGSGIKSSDGRVISNINAYLTQNSAGTLVIENLTSSNIFGTLPTNSYIELSLRFITSIPINSTCNTGYALIPELPEINDIACLGINNKDTDI